MEEIWRPVVGYEGIYEVSNTGRVKSLERWIRRSDGVDMLWHEKIKRLTKNQDGYMTVKLSRNHIDERVAVHRLVYEAFCSAIPDGYEINHKDFDRTNNNVENLEILTHRDNVVYTIEAGRHACSTQDYCGEKNPNYGNRKLSAIYASDPALSRRKQGRPGLKNGRCRQIKVVYPDGTFECFDYIKACAQALIDRGATGQSSVDGVISAIVTSASKNRPYRKMRFEYI